MFPVIEVPNEVDAFEQLGTKPKVWFRANDNKRWLFKYIDREDGRATGEDWSEKVSSELCDLLGLPHACYDFGIWKGHKGVVCPIFVPESGHLIHGNELLVHVDKGYPKDKFYNVREHTLRSVLAIIRTEGINPPIGWKSFTDVTSSLDVFIGYLMLDAWIANQDRHHENWGLILSPKPTVHLAPTFDHASSLGWNEKDEIRVERLGTTDVRRGMESYVEKAHSAFFRSRTSDRPFSTLDAFKEASRFRPAASMAWLARLAQVPQEAVSNVFEQIPRDRITSASIAFACRMLELNRQRLLKFKV